jgi:hypothetical protein
VNGNRKLLVGSIVGTVKIVLMLDIPLEKNFSFSFLGNQRTKFGKLCLLNWGYGCGILQWKEQRDSFQIFLYSFWLTSEKYTHGAVRAKKIRYRK